MITKEQLINAINAYSDARLINNEILLKLSTEHLNEIITELFDPNEKTINS